jgi:uncharacterized protein (DUF697 family)
MDNVARGEEARRIARSYVGWAVGAGLIPFPLVDVGSLVVLQAKMLTKIARVYEVPLGRERARTLVMSTVGGLAPQGVALTGIPALLKFIPVVGTLLGVAVMPAAAASSTLALAEIFIRHIETYGRVPDHAWPRLQAASPALAPVVVEVTPAPADVAIDEPVVAEEGEEISAPGDARLPDAVVADGGPASVVSEREGVDGGPAPAPTTRGLAPVLDASVISGGTLTEEPVAAGDGVVPADPAPGIVAERPVRRSRAKAHRRRRSSPTEKS